MFKNVSKINVNKVVIKEFYTACITYLNETCPDTNFITTTRFDFTLINSEMKIEVNSFEKFNNEVLNNDVFNRIEVMVMKLNIKTNEGYYISFSHKSHKNSLHISSENKLWTDETAQKFQEFFSNNYDKNESKITQINLPENNKGSSAENDLPKSDKSVILDNLPEKTKQQSTLATNKLLWAGVFVVIILALVAVLYPNANISKIKTPFLEAEFSNSNPVIKEEPKHLFQSSQLEDIESIVAENKKSKNTTLPITPKQPAEELIVKKPIFGEDNITKFANSQRIRTTEVLFSYPGRVDATITYEDDLVLESFCGFVEFILKDNLGNIIATYKSRYDCIEGSVGTKKVRYTQPVEKDIANKVSSIEAKAYTK